MKSPLLKLHDPKHWRYLVYREIICPLVEWRSTDGSRGEEFSTSFQGPSSSDIRHLRTNPKTRDRDHIYNFERQKHLDKWVAHIKIHRSPTLLGVFNNAAQQLLLSQAHAPVLLHLVEQEFMARMPKVKIVTQYLDTTKPVQYDLAHEPEEVLTNQLVHMPGLVINYDITYDATHINNNDFL